MQAAEPPYSFRSAESKELERERSDRIYRRNGFIDMCGLIGLFPATDPARFQSALSAIGHRGPDDTGIFDDGRVQLGHQRLAIQDLSANGHQPMQSADGRVCIVFNGEIYNHIDLRGQLPKSIDYVSTTDTETLLYAYLEWGCDFLPKLNGIFALAIYDRCANTLLVARDQLGVKPLYYHNEGGRLWFGSELKAFTRLPEMQRQLNPRALVDYVNFLWSPGEQTPFSHFKKLLPGHYFQFDLSQPRSPVELVKFYELPFQGEYSEASEQQLTDELDDRLCQAVHRQLLSDVPVGFFLSGGLDSSLIAAIARRKVGSSFNSYTIEARTDSSADGFVDDLRYARQVARHLDVHLKVVSGNADIARDFDAMIWHLDEPQADPAPLHVRNICRAARESGDVVLLGGTAGDDLFSGYRRHQAIRWEPWLHAMPNSVGRSIAVACKLLPRGSPWGRRLGKVARELGKRPLERMAGYYCWVDLEYNKSLFAEIYQEELRDHNPADHLLTALSAVPKEGSRLNQMLFWDTKFFLADHNLNYTDKMSMAEGVEVRVPFLDPDLVGFACRMPPALKMRGNTTKYLLKKVAERYLPPEVIYRPKTGFGAPVRKWVMEGKFDLQISDIIRRADSRESVFSKRGIQGLLAATKAKRIDGAYTVWSILAIDSWVRQFADRY